MIRILLAATALLAAAPLAAQSQQNEVDARYDRALAAGYKALFLCSAIANAERNGVNRYPASVEAMELTGTYDRVQSIIGELPYRILRDEDFRVAQVRVDWVDDMPPRFAEASRDDGCRLAPIGLFPSEPEMLAPANPVTNDAPLFPPMRTSLTIETPFDEQIDAGMGDGYGDGTKTTAIVVRSSAYEKSRYAEGYTSLTPQRTWSVAKSIAATLVGVAVHNGEVDVNEPSVRAEWREDGRNSITIDHLLRMASGRYSDTPGNRTDPLYAGGALVEEVATGWPLIYPPGSVFRYANNDTLMAIKAITDQDKFLVPSDFFAAAGMDGAVAETDWAGDYILSSQVWATAEDLAILGQLYLDDGVLPDGIRILPEDWVEYVSTPSGPQPATGTWGYGAGFWLFNNHAGIPADTFLAAGNRGQYVVIVPSRDVVIVRRGEDPVGARFDIEAFTRDVLAALATD